MIIEQRTTNKVQLTLRDKIIISARPVYKKDTLKQYLSEKGAVVIDFPMIEISAAEIDDRIKNILSKLDSFHWIVFTSRNGVKYFFKALKELDHNINNLQSVKIAVIGRSTEEEVKKNGLTPFLVTKGNTSEDLLKEIHSEVQNSIFTVNVLLALGCLASDTMENGLSMIAEVTRIDMYKTTKPRSYSIETLNMIKNNKYYIITFTSPSQVQNFLKITQITNNEQLTKCACIGSTTEKELLKNGIKPVLVSSKSDGITFAKEIEHYLLNLKS